MAPSSPAENLLLPYELSSALTLANRIAMAPMTRSMAGPGLIPTPAMAEYYARRATAGLLITEGAIVRADGQGYPDVPGIFTDAQVEGWREVTRRSYLGGELPIAPSAVALEGRVPRSGGLEYGTPREASTDEIQDVVDAYAGGAANALAAGFDGVEIHGANGYLIDQFLHHHTNRRDDGYGGSPAAMSRFALEVVDAVAARADAGRVGIRLSPGAYFNMESHPDDAKVFRHLLEELEKRSLAGFTPESAAAAVADDAVDLVAFGRGFIANPDLVARIRAGQALEPYDQEMLARLE